MLKAVLKAFIKYLAKHLKKPLNTIILKNKAIVFNKVFIIALLSKGCIKI